MIRILLVSHFFPYPPNHGSAADIWGQILSMEKLGSTVDLIATDSEFPTAQNLDAVRARVRSFWFVHRHRGLRQFLRVRPFQVESRRGLKNVALSDEYDVVLLQSEYVADVLRNDRLRAKHVILRVHNNEVRYYHDLSSCSATAREKVFFLAEALKFRLFSPHFRSKCDQMWFISDYEREEHAARYPEDSAKSLFLPSDVDLSSMRTYAPFGNNVLFVGALTRAMNMRGLQWYLREVHPKLSRREGYRLVIAGYTHGESIQWLKDACRGYDNVSLFPDVDDLLPLYEGAAVFANPIFAGAGLKVKTIRALEAGVPVVTTTIGAEGTGLRNNEHLLIADSSEGFLAAVLELLSNRNKGRMLVDQAQEYLKDAYDQRSRMISYLASYNCR
jgi:glycosyltransferase involved in cell wall biosynthesis